MENEFEKTAIRVSLVSVVWNLILSVFKLIAGFVGLYFFLLKLSHSIPSSDQTDFTVSAGNPYFL